MSSHDRKFRAADVVAAFDSQDDADEAVLELREIGVRDDHIGYFSYTPDAGPIILFGSTSAGRRTGAGCLRPSFGGP